MGLTLSTLGCSDAFNAGPLKYVERDALTKELPGKANLAAKPALQAEVRQALASLYGENPQRINVPDGAPLLDGGIYLANYRLVGEGENARPKRIYRPLPDGTPDFSRPQAGGYALYRRNCLHCHGVSGAGDGPTAPFLYPSPRDYRKGVFKFTSTAYGARPHRDDLRRTIKNGLHGTSMPAFDALLSEDELEEVIDYVVFLSIRGETEQELIEEASNSNALSADTIKDIATGVFTKWKLAQTGIQNPPIARTPSSHESILRGRELFSKKSDCFDCHGPLALGNGTKFMNQEDFNTLVFDGNPSERPARIQAFLEKLPDELKTVWRNQNNDDWGNPLRPANLQRGIYKGGRRPIDLYWRIAKGINGAQMPGHYPSLNEHQIWDLVNFVLALPYQPELLTDANSTTAAPTIASTAGQP
jgi:mono/diheme cytochrome c family protein